MTAFEVGFLKEASEYGLTSQQADHILKRALQYDEARDMFKSLSNSEEDEEDPSDLDALTEMLQQDLINRYMSAAQHRIQL
jgi:hypothetical protein